MLLILECIDYFYGGDCNTTCGHCVNNGVCDKDTGQCPNGCQTHWTGNRCDGRSNIKRAL